jgi:hypothetical protein
MKNLNEFNFHDWLLNHTNKKHFESTDVIQLLREFATEELQDASEAKI